MTTFLRQQFNGCSNKISVVMAKCIFMSNIEKPMKDWVPSHWKKKPLYITALGQNPGLAGACTISSTNFRQPVFPLHLRESLQTQWDYLDRNHINQRHRSKQLRFARADWDLDQDQHKCQILGPPPLPQNVSHLPPPHTFHAP